MGTVYLIARDAQELAVKEPDKLPGIAPAKA